MSHDAAFDSRLTDLLGYTTVGLVSPTHGTAHV